MWLPAQMLCKETANHASQEDLGHEFRPLTKTSLDEGVSDERIRESLHNTFTPARKEAAQILWSSLPAILTYLIQYSLAFVNLLVLGHIGASELAAASLANMTTMIAINAPAVGLASALDTYCSTAFTASQDTTLVGFHLQRGIIAVTGHFLFIVPLLWNIDTLFIWLKQDPTVSHMCCHFMRVQLLGSLAWMYFECIKRYLQAQGHMRASTVVLLIIAPIHVANNYMFVWSPVVGMGFLGAAFANVVTYWLMFVLITVYAARSDARNAWGGWNVHALWTMPQYFKLAIPSMIMICSEWWILDLLALAASYLGSVTLAAQSIVINTCTLTYQFADGQSVAVCNRVGNLLGQERPRHARICATVGMSLGVCTGVICLGFGVLSRNWWGRVYSQDEQVVACVALIMPANALFQLADAVNSVGSGILRSMARQTAGAWINFVAYYILGFPLGLFLTYGPPKTGVLGLWFGLFLGVTLAVLLQCWIILRANWDDEVQRSVDRISEDADRVTLHTFDTVPNSSTISV